MSSGLRVLARLVTLAAALTVYVTLHLLISTGMALNAADRFHGAPAHAEAFTAALGDPAELRTERAWFDRNAPASIRSTVATAAEAGRTDQARAAAAGLVGQVTHEQARLDRELAATARTTLWWAPAAAVLLWAALHLRRRRRRAAAEVAALASQFAQQRPWWWRPVFRLANGAGNALVAGGTLAVMAAEQNGQKMTLTVQLLCLAGGLPLLGLGILVVKYTRPRSARGAAQALLADGRRPVLYLRSFADDPSADEADPGPMVGPTSREEQLARALTAIGPVIAVGKPGEPLPQLGAARFYLPLDDWQPTVARLMTLSQLIVLRLGQGAGLWWEVEQSRTTQPPEKLLLLTTGRAKELAEAAARLDRYLPEPSRLAELATGDDWVSMLITFGPDWTPRTQSVTELTAAKPGRHALGRAYVRAKRASAAISLPQTPTRQLAQAMRTALKPTGVGRWTMPWRAFYGQEGPFWAGTALLTRLVLAAVLAYRAGQLLASL